MITREFLESEITELRSESVKANTFLIQSEAVIRSYEMLLSKFDGSSNTLKLDKE